jgi:hypothetical protein
MMLSWLFGEHRLIDLPLPKLETADAMWGRDCCCGDSNPPYILLVAVDVLGHRPME